MQSRRSVHGNNPAADDDAADVPGADADHGSGRDDAAVAAAAAVVAAAATTAVATAAAVRDAAACSWLR